MRFDLRALAPATRERQLASATARTGEDPIAMHLEVLDVTAANALRKRLIAPPKLDLAENIKAAAKVGGRDYVRRLVKAVRGPGKPSVHEFFYFRLYDQGLTEASLARFVGKRIQHQMHMACNDARWFAACDDKLLWSAILAGARLPIPETVAVFSEKGRHGIYRPLADQATLAQFIADPAKHPLFCKPVDGMFSIGAFRVEGASGNMLMLGGGEQRSAEDVARFMSSLSPAGYLLQKVMKPAAEMAPILGNALASIRFLVLLTEQGPAVESAVIKIPMRDQVADNYWRDGNMLGAIDLNSGRIARIVTGTGAKLRVIEHDAAGSGSLVGSAVPDFDAARSLCLKAAALFPGIRTQSWDVALTADGPVLLELNFGGDVNLHQLAHNRGILSDSYCRHLRTCGYKRRLPA
jgi:putative polysaccharide biosynthesis protein